MDSFARNIVDGDAKAVTFSAAVLAKLGNAVPIRVRALQRNGNATRTCAGPVVHAPNPLINVRIQGSDAEMIALA